MYTSTHIRKTSASDNIEEYLNCVQDLMRSGTENVSNIKLKLKRQKDDYETYVYLLDGKIVVDQTVTTFFKSPKSYTGEDMVEISCHGSISVINKITKTLLPDKATNSMCCSFD